MQRSYRFAGLEFTFLLPRDFADQRTLAPFAVSAVTDPHRYHFSIVDALSPPEGVPVAQTPALREYITENARIRYQGPVQESWHTAHTRAHHQGKEHHIQLLESQFYGIMGVHVVLNTLALEHLLAREGGFLLHASCIEYNSKAILFTAPSGTGKSTQAQLWQDLRGARILNGDRMALRFEDGLPLACGIPYAGSSRICENVTLPVAAIVCLDQASATTIRPLRGYEAFRRLWEGCSVNTWDREDVDMISAAVTKVIDAVPVFHLPCTPDESAVTALEQMLGK